VGLLTSRSNTPDPELRAQIDAALQEIQTWLKK